VLLLGRLMWVLLWLLLLPLRLHELPWLCPRLLHRMWWLLLGVLLGVQLRLLQPQWCRLPSWRRLRLQLRLLMQVPSLLLLLYWPDLLRPR
jgi:hypothetical protein